YRLRIADCGPSECGMRNAGCGMRTLCLRIARLRNVFQSAIRIPQGVDAANFVDFDLHYALAFGVGDAVPFARGAHSEDHVGAVAVLDDVTDDPTLLIGDHSAGVIQNRDDRNVQTWLRCVVHLLSDARYSTGR